MILLVVDDSFAVRRLLVNELRMSRLRPDEVLEAGDGLEALTLLARAVPDVILCDYHMPRLDGLKFAAAVRERYSADQVKIILLTAHGSTDLGQTAREAGVDRVVDKPADVHSLVEIIAQLTRRPDPSTETHRSSTDDPPSRP
jgi:CheY-like chemotaxis protein